MANQIYLQVIIGDRMFDVGLPISETDLSDMSPEMIRAQGQALGTAYGELLLRKKRGDL